MKNYLLKGKSHGNVYYQFLEFFGGEKNDETKIIKIRAFSGHSLPFWGKMCFELLIVHEARKCQLANAFYRIKKY